MRFMARPQFKVVVTYLVVGALWIWFSDWALEGLIHSPEALTRAQNLKGWAFVGVTAVLLYFLVRGHFQALQQRHLALIESYDQTIRGWIRVMDLRHEETRGHTERVARMTVSFARAAGVAEHRLETLWRGALLHDIGKIGIPDRILIKPGALNDDEWAMMRTHPEIGRSILAEIDFLRPSIEIPWCHHEKWEQVLEHSRGQAGRHFDPELIEVFLDNYSAIVAEGRADGSTQNP